MNVLSSSASLPPWRIVCLAALCWVLALAPVLAQEGNAPAPSTGHPAASVVNAPSAVEAIKAAEHEDAHSEGLPAASPVLFKIGPLPVNSSMVLTWCIALGVILFARYATKNVQQVPGGAQNFWEWLVESLRNFLESIIGRDLTRRTYWFFATVFIFILFTNWFGLLPGVGTIGWGIPNAHGELTHISKPLLRGTNADLNMTLSMSLIFFVCWFYWALTTNGVGGFLLHLFGPKGETKGIIKVMMVIIFAFVGVLEIVSILFRPVSLSFRLYGNIFAGENMLEAMSNLIPALGGIIPVPFYFMELLVGIVQALVFMLLTAVFTLLICSHGDESHPEPGHHH